MRVRHANGKLERLEHDEAYEAGFSGEIATMYRKRMQFIRAAVDERDFYALKSLRYEKLKGKRAHQRSMRLNKQFRLVIETRDQPDGKTIVILSIEDYH